MLCEHANESPLWCPCKAGCDCRKDMCIGGPRRDWGKPDCTAAEVQDAHVRERKRVELTDLGLDFDFARRVASLTTGDKYPVVKPYLAVVLDPYAPANERATAAEQLITLGVLDVATGVERQAIRDAYYWNDVTVTNVINTRPKESSMKRSAKNIVILFSIWIRDTGNLYLRQVVGQPLEMRSTAALGETVWVPCTGEVRDTIPDELLILKLALAKVFADLPPFTTQMYPAGVCVGGMQHEDIIEIDLGLIETTKRMKYNR